MQQSQEQQFIVEHYYITFFEIMPTAPAYVLDSDESYTVEVTTSLYEASVACGNLTVQVHARPVNSSSYDYRLVTEEYLPWVLRELNYNNVFNCLKNYYYSIELWIGIRCQFRERQELCWC